MNPFDVLRDVFLQMRSLAAADSWRSGAGWASHDDWNHRCGERDVVDKGGGDGADVGNLSRRAGSLVSQEGHLQHRSRGCTYQNNCSRLPRPFVKVGHHVRELRPDKAAHTATREPAVREDCKSAVRLWPS